MKPLSTNYKMPCKQDLSGFWNRVERALKGLGKSIITSHFDENHIRVVAPVILGDAVWDLFSEINYRDWSTFKSTVERRFGLTK